MKRFWGFRLWALMMSFILLSTSYTGVVIASDGARSPNSSTTTPAPGTVGILTPEQAKRKIAARASVAIQAIRRSDMKTLASLVHPTKGVRFSPYSYVSVGKDQVFSSAQVRKLLTSKRSYLWGVYDGSGKAIRLAPLQYWHKFVYDVDFARKAQINYNRITGQGNTMENLSQVYKGAIAVEYYIPGTNPKYGGMDWKSLRLVFQQYKSKWYLVGIVHNQWTI